MGPVNPGGLLACCILRSSITDGLFITDRRELVASRPSRAAHGQPLNYCGGYGGGREREMVDNHDDE